jgi:hypothetical protein
MLLSHRVFPHPHLPTTSSFDRARVAPISASSSAAVATESVILWLLRRLGTSRLTMAHLLAVRALHTGPIFLLLAVAGDMPFSVTVAAANDSLLFTIARFVALLSAITAKIRLTRRAVPECRSACVSYYVKHDKTCFIAWVVPRARYLEKCPAGEEKS